MRALLLSLIVLRIVFTAAAQPVSQHKENPHYLEWKGEPIVLVTSAEHYGAVLNSEFDYVSYLRTLYGEGLNLTRIFTGSYIEESGAFGIEKNTLAPAPGKALTPWARSDEPGNSLGGNKFNLDEWDSAYFARLHDFLSTAERYNIIVELTFFSSTYGAWHNSPLHHTNNINGVDEVELKDAHTLENGNLLECQERMVRKIVRELNRYDNLYYEIQNEPWSDNPDSVDVIHEYIQAEHLKDANQIWRNRVDLANEASLEWQQQVTDWVIDEEKGLAKKHLIAQNYTNFRYPVRVVPKGISIINFHYASPDAVWLNYDHPVIIGFDETGFTEPDDFLYRRQAWEFIIAGGGIYNALDYSFTVKSPRGRADNDAPGIHSAVFRRQLSILRNFIMSFDLAEMRPDRTSIKFCSAGIPVLLSNPGQQYAMYASAKSGRVDIEITLPKGTYHAEWKSVIHGGSLSRGVIQSAGGEVILKSPVFADDIALAIMRVN